MRGRTDDAEPRAGTDAPAADGVHAAELQVGRDEGAAAHAHHAAGPRDATGEAHATGARGAHDAARARDEIDPAMLAGVVRPPGRDGERAAHLASQRPAPRRLGGRDDEQRQEGQEDDGEGHGRHAPRAGAAPAPL